MSSNTATTANAPAQIVWVPLLNALENPRAQGKWRPAMLISREGPQWVVMGLTTNPTYRDGQARVPVPNPAAVGLSGPGFLWGWRTARICVLDLGSPIGWADHDLAELVISIAHLSDADAVAIEQSVVDHHGPRSS